MREEDFDAFSDMLSGVMDALGKKVPSAHGLVIWFRALAHYDLAGISEAFSRYVRNPDSNGFLIPSDIVKMLEGSTADSAMIAWSHVDQAMRRFGPWWSVVFDDPLIHRVLQEMGGWIELSKADDDAWPFRAREFQTRYRGLKARGETPEHPEVMLGHFAAGNALEMRKTQPPLLLGNPAQALKVMRSGTDKPLLEMAVAAEHLRQDVSQLSNKLALESARDIDFSDDAIGKLRLA